MNPHQIKEFCKRCKLHKFAHKKSVCLKGKNTEGRRRLMIFSDTPDYFADHMHAPYKMDAGKILDWLLARMSVDPKDVAYDYTLRCYAGKNLPTTKATRATPIEECACYRFRAIERVRPKAIVALGQVSMEAFTGKTKVGDFQGRLVPCWEPRVRDIVPAVWISYGLTGITMPEGASNSGRVFRVLFLAAQHAGLHPKINPNIPPFQWKSSFRK